jgi:hypothetical protein
MRLEQPEQPTEPPVRHDLFELDRKRKLLLEEVETIKRMKLEQVTFAINHFKVETVKKMKLITISKF